MSENEDGRKSNSSRGEDQARPIWNDEKGRDGNYYSGGDKNTRSEGCLNGYQSQPVSREICKGRDFDRNGSETVGKIVVQLIEDCLNQLKLNQQNIDSLVAMNQSLEAKIDYYQRLLKDINLSE